MTLTKGKPVGLASCGAALSAIGISTKGGPLGQERGSHGSFRRRHQRVKRRRAAWQTLAGARRPPSHPSYARVGEPTLTHLFWAVDIPQVDHLRRAHQQTDTVEVEGAELV